MMEMIQFVPSDISTLDLKFVKMFINAAACSAIGEALRQSAEGEKLGISGA